MSFKRPRPPPDVPPRPLQVGEHVVPISSGSTGSLVHAVVVALDAQYTAAASHFLEARARVPSSPNPDLVSPNSQPTVDLTRSDSIDLDADDPSLRVSQAIVFIEAHGKRPKLGHTGRRIRDSSVLHDELTEKPDSAPAPHPITVGRVYIHFLGRDRRLDRWENAADLQRVSASTIAAAAEGAVANTLVDHAVHSEFAHADTSKTHQRKLTRAMRREYEASNPTSEREIGDEVMARMEKAREEKTKVRNISCIVFGDYSIDAWYYSPFPAPFSALDTLYMCGICLKYVRTARQYCAHRTRCSWKDPPGYRVYHHGERSVSVYEINSVVHPGYCQRLCLLGKLFLDHKTLFYDVSPFLFYVITLEGKIAGFFSKENTIVSSEFNLACILTLPQHQKKGIGRFLISLSYELTKMEGKTASPERPLSDLGQVSYRSYWSYAVTQYLHSKCDTANVPVKEVAEATGIRSADVTTTLKEMKLVSIWKGEIFADSSGKVIDSAMKKISSPQIPLIRSRLSRCYNVQKQKSPLSAAGKPPVGSTMSLRSSPEPSRRKVGRPRLLKTIETTSLSSTPSRPVPKSILKSPIDFTQWQLERMQRFIDFHSPATIQAPLNRRKGLDPKKVEQLAKELGVTGNSCIKKLREMALDMYEMDADTVGTAGGSHRMQYSARHPEGMADPRDTFFGHSNGMSFRHPKKGMKRAEEGAVSLPFSPRRDVNLVEKQSERRRRMSQEGGRSHVRHMEQGNDSDVVVIASQSSDG